MRVYLITFAASLVPVLPLTVIAIWLGKRLELTDIPDARKVHREPTPSIGGGAIYFSMAIAVLLALPFLVAERLLSFEEQRAMWFLLVAGTTIFVLGLVDDIKALRARVKLAVQLLAASLVCYGGVRIDAIAFGQSEPVSLGWFAWPATVLWVVGIMNAINLSDGVDGLATSISIIAFGTVAALAIWTDQAMPAVLALAALGALTGFLPFNCPPARIFLGDSGSLFLGFMIAVSSVLGFMKFNAFPMLALSASALGIPILDTLLAILRRLTAGRPVFAADRGHFHHRLAQSGLRHYETIGFVCVLTLILIGLGALTWGASVAQILALVIGGVVLLGGVFWAVGVFRFAAIVAGLQRRFLLGRQTAEGMNEYCRLQLQFDQARTVEAWWEALYGAIQRLGYAWISVAATDASGAVETHVWRCSEIPPHGMRLTIVRIPAKTMADNAAIEIEAAIPTNGSVEGAIRRAFLLGRLVDEHGVPACSINAFGPDSTIGRGAVRTEPSVPMRLAVPLGVSSVPDRSDLPKRATVPNTD